MPALNAIRCNPEFKTKYQAMINVGKPAKVAIAAIMRKLLILANENGPPPPLDQHGHYRGRFGKDRSLDESSHSSTCAASIIAAIKRAFSQLASVNQKVPQLHVGAPCAAMSRSTLERPRLPHGSHRGRASARERRLR